MVKHDDGTLGYIVLPDALDPVYCVAANLGARGELVKNIDDMVEAGSALVYDKVLDGQRYAQTGQAYYNKEARQLPVLPTQLNNSLVYQCVAMSTSSAKGSYFWMTPRFAESTGLVSSSSSGSGSSSGGSSLAAPTSAPDLTAASDTGVSNTDNITEDTKPVFSVGALPSGAAGVSLRVNGVEVVSSYNVTTGEVALATELSNGSHSITYAYIDTSGGRTGPSPSLSITIVNGVSTPPASLAAPALAPDLADASDTGASDTDGITADTTPSFYLPALPPGASGVTVWVNGVEVISTYNASTNEVTLPSGLSDGVKNITYAYVAPNGAETGPSPGLSITIATGGTSSGSSSSSGGSSNNSQYATPEESCNAFAKYVSAHGGNATCASGDQSTQVTDVTELVIEFDNSIAGSIGSFTQQPNGGFAIEINGAPVSFGTFTGGGSGGSSGGSSSGPFPIPVEYDYPVAGPAASGSQDPDCSLPSFVSTPPCDIAKVTGPTTSSVSYVCGPTGFFTSATKVSLGQGIYPGAGACATCSKASASALKATCTIAPC